jgi:hypothetical protein
MRRTLPRARARSLRLQTGTTSLFGSLLGGTPGISYGTDSKNLTIGARGGRLRRPLVSLVGGDIDLTMPSPTKATP